MKNLLENIVRVIVVCSSISIIDGFASSRRPTAAKCSYFSSSSSSKATRTRTVAPQAPPRYQQQKMVLSAAGGGDAAAEMLRKAAKIREELAMLEGKTVEQVENEAQEKKDRQNKTQQQMRQQQEERKSKEAQEKKENGGSGGGATNKGRYLEVPGNVDDMTYQASKAIERAFQDGIKRQTIRLALINIKEDGEYITSQENQWPGGQQQVYREAGKPLTNKLLKEIYAPTKTKEELLAAVGGESQKNNAKVTPPTVKHQDIWDFDGSALHTAEASYGANGDVQALVFPNTDTKYLNDIEQLDKDMGERLLLLINPFWRNIDSWSFNILAPNAQKRAQKILFDNPPQYEETYVLNRYSARGEDCVALKAYPYDWQLFAFREQDDAGLPGVEYAIRLGSLKEEPKLSDFSKLLDERPEFKLNKNMRNMNKFF